MQYRSDGLGRYDGRGAWLIGSAEKVWERGMTGGARRGLGSRAEDAQVQRLGEDSCHMLRDGKDHTYRALSRVVQVMYGVNRQRQGKASQHQDEDEGCNPPPPPARSAAGCC